MDKLMSSPTRKYVVMCNKTNFDGFYFRTFTLPPGWRNNQDVACWFFLNRLNSFACVETCMTWEDYQSLTEIVRIPEHVLAEPIPETMGEEPFTPHHPWCSVPTLGSCNGVGCDCPCHLDPAVRTEGNPHPPRSYHGTNTE